MNEQTKWIRILIIVGSLILLIVGYIIGYYTNKGCIENPFLFSIKKVNKLNNDNYQCSCRSQDGSYFYFNETKIWEENLLNQIPLVG